MNDNSVSLYKFRNNELRVVKRTVERLANKGVIDVPAMEEDQITTSHGRNR